MPTGQRTWVDSHDCGRLGLRSCIPCVGILTDLGPDKKSLRGILLYRNIARRVGMPSPSVLRLRTRWDGLRPSGDGE